jgi:hypothetical protein
MAIQYKNKKINVIVNKVGLTENVAHKCINISKKYCIWIANQIKEYKLDIENNEVITNLNNILNWKKEVQGKNLNNYNYKQALKEYDKYIKSLFISTEGSLENKNVVVDCGNFKWVELTKGKDFSEEGSHMNHCIGGSSYFDKYISGKCRYFSLRDSFNKPHITIEAKYDSKNNTFLELLQINGNSNQIPKETYTEYIYNLHEKFRFKSHSGYNEVFIRNFNLSKKIHKLTHNFFDFETLLKIGIIPNLEGIYAEDIDLSLKADVFKIKKNTMLYSNLKLTAENTVFLFYDNVLIGGDLILDCKEVKIKSDLKVGGNVYIKGSIDKDSIKKIKSFGNIVIEKKEELETV